MKILEQGAYMNYVNRLNENEVLSQAMLLNTQFEGSASLVFDVAEFKITQARWTIHRANDPDARGESELPDLLGKSAYIDGGKAIKKLPDFSRIVKSNPAPGEPVNEDESCSCGCGCTGGESAVSGEDSEEWGKIKELLLECIRGAFQAEAFLLEYRGYSNVQDYEVFWQSDKKDYCRPYTGGMPGLEEWPIYIGSHGHYRKENLYNKYKSYCIIDRGSGKAYAIGTYNDSFHEMNVELNYDSQSGIIEDYDMTAVRVPFNPCTELSHTASELFIGKDIRSLAKRDVGKLIGGPMGCFHLVDIVADVAAAVRDLKK